MTRHPINDAAAWLNAQGEPTRRALIALGELLAGVTDRDADEPENATGFTVRCLGVRHLGEAATEEHVLAPVARLTAALALAELLDEHDGAVELGPGMYADPPAWMTSEIGDTTYRHPASLRAGFPAGTLIDGVPCVVAIRVRDSHVHTPQLTIFVHHTRQAEARAVLDRLMARAAELSPYRGRAVRTSYSVGLKLTVIDLPAALTRDTVVVAETVWREIDLGVTAVRDRHQLLNAHGLGARRGVLLVGPPGTGKSAVSAVIAAEVVGTFTVIYVEARAGEALLTSVVSAAQQLGGPVLLVLEDVDLWCRDRNRGNGGGGLSELLQAMDIAPDARILTLASTNDAATLDAAAIRTGRFDSIVEVGYPTRADAARILAALLAGLPGGTAVDTAAVASRLPEQTSGSDLREIVRRAVLSNGDDGELTTASLLAEVGDGRYKATVPGAGQYL
ncbi:AAA family ATPase [[Mycobacterium] burgundiense]|uniref:ATP-binding protein n=1 Tax=[Mycobacterium] burgundiense TaxID=3064286 RepID=A0ABM9LV60_9MYCO|nr:ATP-binding protein [Mycolicibacterium sp. MU0053]CAJ1505281.1 ATP-binding protein [Mycolicibacterium sp. MU0053]